MNAKMVIEGAPRLMAALRMMDSRTRANVISVIDAGTKAVVAEGIARVPKRTGELAWTIRAEFSKDKLTGFAKAGFGKLLRRSRAKNPDVERHQALREARKMKARLGNTSRQGLTHTELGVYAPVVERGDKRRNHKAHPFLVPALKDNEPSIIAGLNEAPIAAGRSEGLA